VALVHIVGYRAWEGVSRSYGAGIKCGDGVSLTRSVYSSPTHTVEAKLPWRQEIQYRYGQHPTAVVPDHALVSKTSSNSRL
jgi:hypothetical protein